MSFKNESKYKRLSNTNLKQIAAQGVERALAARKTAGMELSSEQLRQIGGGSILSEWIILAGGYIFGKASGASHV